MLKVDFSRRRTIQTLLVLVLFSVWPADVVQAQQYRGLKPKIAAVLEEHKVPGASVAIAIRNRIVWAEGVGVMETGTDRRVSRDTLFQAASISKPVAALAALRLVDQGQLSLDQPVGRLLKTHPVQGAERVTLRQLLSHSAGMTIHGFAGYESEKPFPTLEQVLAGTVPANSTAIFGESEPGVAFKYSGGGYCVLQQLMIETTATDFPKLLQDSVLTPLKMADSTYVQPLPDALRENAAAGHLTNGSVVPGKHNVYPEMAAAGLWTTASDLARFAIGVQESFAGESDSLLAKQTATAMLTPQVTGGPGLGLFVGGDAESGVFEHSGANHGFRAKLIASKMPGSVLVIMTNSDQGDRVFEPIQALVRTSR